MANRDLAEPARQPVRSMTGFGTGASSWGARRIIIEVRSVNNRFLDLQVKTPRTLAAAEGVVREHLHGKLGRGTVTVTISLEEGAAGDRIGADFWKACAQELREIAHAAGLSADIGLEDLIRWAQARKGEDPSGHATQDIRPAVSEALDKALGEYDAMRKREGDHLLQDVLARLGRIEGALAQVAPLAPLRQERYLQQLRARIQELLGDVAVDETRLAQETAHMADRLDVSEELVRFASHNAQFRETLVAGGAVGKRLNFLLQEMLREANTLGSKCQDPAITQHVISLKEEIESIREQAANFE